MMETVLCQEPEERSGDGVSPRGIQQRKITLELFAEIVVGQTV